MNYVILIGRLTRDPDARYTTGENPTSVSRFTLAVDRRSRKQEGIPTADFISCVAFGRQGEFADKYLRRGMKIALRGRIQTGSYVAQDGQKVYTTDVVAEDIEFCEKKTDGDASHDTASAPSPKTVAPTQASMNDFVNIADDGIEEDLPFT